MTVDLEAIARRGRCEVSSLRNALPLLQQGYSPPFLARYRRDELGGIDEANLWALSASLREEQAVAAEREHLRALWEATPLADPSLGHAIRKANSRRMLERLARRLKLETADHASPGDHLAVRLLNPRKGDGADIDTIVSKLESISQSDVANAREGLDDALANRLAGDPRVITAAVKWLSKNAKINVVSISDPHAPGTENQEADTAAAESVSKAHKQAETTEQASAETSEPSPTVDAASKDPGTDADGGTGAAEVPADQGSMPPAVNPETTASVDATANTEAVASTEAEATSAEVSSDSEPTSDPKASSDPTTSSAPSSSSALPVSSDPKASSDSPSSGPAASGGSAGKTSRKPKKMSPRQRRRRWLVSVLKPLAGKRFAAGKLSSFQIVMLGRALRSQVAQCSFEYDAAKLVKEIQRTVSGINRQIESKLTEIVLEHEAKIREAAEAAWWDELHERASSRLVGILADHLRSHINRGCVDSKVVMSIDAVGPRTAATSIVSADGRVLHCEDLPCQLSATLRSQAVAKMGELIHRYHIDLIVISNGPARRGCMIALKELIGQSPEKSVRWTLADRTGADVYAGSGVANQEMRSTPRRFRAAAWLAFSVLQPAQAFAKVDPLKLRLASFQRELSDDAVATTLENVVISGASRGGVDVNSASTEWLGRLPGMTSALAQAIDSRRRHALLKSRAALLELDDWQSVVESRQALPFLRVFGSEEVLDGTLIHPDDYPLAKKLARSLEVELPPAAPPGYQPPTFETESEPATEPALSESPASDEKPEVEDVTAAVENKSDDAFAGNVDVEESVASTEESLADAGVAETSEPSEATNESEGEQAPTSPLDAGALPATSGQQATTEAEAEPQPESAEQPESMGAGESESSGEPGSPDQPGPADQPSAASETAPSPPEPVRRPRPDQAKIDKCIKEWQIGARRANQLVSWLCDPFGDSDLSGRPPAVLTNMPTQKSLNPGDEVIGVVVGVMPFGVFVELAPDCSGLIHISKISDKYVEDLHEAIQVGDVITAWVTGIDQKKRRVALSAVSPEREAELQEQRQQPRAKGGRPQRAGDRPPRGGDRSGGQSGKPAGHARARGGGQDRSRGRSAGVRGRGRDGGRGRYEKKPESYRVVSKRESAPISDAMKKGEEPLRSFGDLLQFYSKEDESQKTAEQQEAGSAETEPQVKAEAAKAPPPTDTTPPQPAEASPPPADTTSPPPAEKTSPPPAETTSPPPDSVATQAQQEPSSPPAAEQDSGDNVDDQPDQLPTSPDTPAS